MAEKEKQISDLQLEVKMNENLVKSSKSRLVKKTATIEGLKNNISNLVSTIAAFKTKAKDQITQYKNLEESYAKEKKEMSQEIENSKKTEDSLKKELGFFKELSDFLKKELDSSDDVKKSLKTKLQSAKECNATLNKKLQEDLKSSEDKTLDKKLSESQRKITQLREEVKQLKVEKDNCSNVISRNDLDVNLEDKEKEDIKIKLSAQENELRILKEETYRYENIHLCRHITTKFLRKPINGLYRFERLVVIDLSRLDKNGSINGLQNDKINTN